MEMVLSSFELLERLEARGEPGCMPSLPTLCACAISCRVALLDLCMFSPPLREAGDPENSAREPCMLSSHSHGHAVVTFLLTSRSLQVACIQQWRHASCSPTSHCPSDAIALQIPR